MGEEHNDADSGRRTYVSAAQVRARYAGVSDMTLWRWLDNRDPGFPRPLYINGRRFWNESDLTAWKRTRRASGDAA
jgi:predicted DNA-binding transcriptional regulator AlpA